MWLWVCGGCGIDCDVAGGEGDDESADDEDRGGVGGELAADC